MKRFIKTGRISKTRADATNMGEIGEPQREVEAPVPVRRPTKEPLKQPTPEPEKKPDKEPVKT
jgi:hypothetical protein